MQHASMRTRSGRGSFLTELGPAVWFFLIFVLIPIFDLISLGLGAATVMVMSSWGARQAAPAATYGDAQAAVWDTESRLASFMIFARIYPVTPPHGVSCNVIVAPVTGSGDAIIYSFADRSSIPIDTNNNVYQYAVTAKYNVLPLFNFSGAAVLGNIPGLGAPVPISYSTQVLVEHPGGVTSDVTSNN